MPKKSGKSKVCKYNGYSVYVKENHESVGVTYTEGFEALRQKWKDLSEADKDYYNAQAKEKNKNKSKMTGAGYTFEEVEE